MTSRYESPDRLRGEAGWLHTRLRCLGFEWSIFTNDPLLREWITSLYECCLDENPGPGRHVFVLYRHTSSDSTVSLHRNSRAILQRAPAEAAIAQLVWEVNRGVVDEAGDRLLLHAAAAEQDGTSVLLAGPEGSGKSTLVAALVCAGLQYVTDETVALDPHTGTIAPHPKPLGLDRGSLESLKDLCRVVPTGIRTGSEQWLVSAATLREDAVATSNSVPTLIVLPSYRPDRATVARSIARAEAAVAIVEQSFNFRTFGRPRLDVIADVVRRCHCYRLNVGDLDVARRLAIDLFSRAVASS
jgi:hypothetical protein